MTIFKNSDMLTAALGGLLGGTMARLNVAPARAVPIRPCTPVGFRPQCTATKILITAAIPLIAAIPFEAFDPSETIILKLRTADGADVPRGSRDYNRVEPHRLDPAIAV